MISDAWFIIGMGWVFLDFKVPIPSVLNMVILTGIVGQSREIIFIKRKKGNFITNSHRINGSLLF